MIRTLSIVLGLILTAWSLDTHAAEVPDFNTRVLPVFRKYCNSCHNAREAEGGLILEDFARAMKGGDDGAVVVAGKSADSRLWKLLTATDETRMPPLDQAAPKPEELALIKAWIDGGAKPPEGGLAAAGLVTPRIELHGKSREPLTSIAVSNNGKWIARAKLHSVEILNASDHAVIQTLVGHTGLVNDINFSPDSKLLSVAAGETGLSGEVTLWKTDDWSRGPIFRGHRDSVYSARISPDGSLLATASYDRDALIWKLDSGKVVQTLTGHNDAIFGVAFSPDGRFVATASGDRTVKLWDVASGQRMDTFSQPAKEQYTVAYSPDGRFVAAGGVDFRLRVWQISDQAKEGTNPILYARFAHEGPILKVVYSSDGRLLATSSEDRLIKLWETRTYTQVAVLPKQEDWSPALSFSHDNRSLLVGRMNGEMHVYPVDPKWGDAASPLTPLTSTIEGTNSRSQRQVVTVAETEPNDSPIQATRLSVPGTVTAKLMAANGTGPDQDFYRFDSEAEQTWIIETNAARSGSLADTKIEVLHSDGRPVVRALLQAVRDSWINFRPIDSSSPDVRLEFWEEMDLNQFVYLNGEICKTFRAPQGPDSGFQLYTINGKRRNYLDTSATAHAKDEPCYIVEAYPVGSKIVENGLPIFPLGYANDDDAERKLDKDSRLTFTAPAAGTYLVKVTDVRGFSGDKFGYTLTVRPPEPDFSVTINTMNPKIPAGSGQRLKFTLNRIDNFEGDLRLDLAGLPDGFSASSPVLIAAGHLETTSVLSAAPDAPEPKAQDWARTTILATGLIDGRLVTRTVGSLGEIKLEKAPPIRVTLIPDDPRYVSADGGLVILPGTTITAQIVVERNGFDGDVKFDVDNLPHGVIVDNIGLSGVLVRAGETRRQIFLTARPWVEPTSRLIHAVSQVQGNQATRAIELRVVRKDSVATR
jgi:WD40 repeat protein